VVAGTYTLTVTDISGCEVTLTETILENPPLLITNVTSQPTSCQGASNGGFTITATGGRVPYYFSVNNGPIQLGNTFTNLSEGSYTITVSDADGCTATATNAVLDGLPFELVVDSQSGALCAGQNNGEIVLAPVNGTAPFEYSTNGIIYQSSNVFSGLAPGTYTFFARDAAGCLASATATFQNITPVNITLVRKSDVSCFGGSDGSLTTFISGGTPPYTIEWNPGGMDTAIVDNLSAGNYTISVTDFNGCTTQATFNVAEPTEIVSTMSITQPECVGKQNGLALVGVNGGTTPYSFEWNTTPVQFGVLANQLEGGQTYLVTITDGKGCTKVDTAVVENPDPIEVNTVPSSVSCFAGSNGEVVIEVIGGSAPYTYELNGIYQTDSIYTGLTAGNYVVFVEDNKGCVATTTFSISTISDLEVDLTGNGVSNLLRAVRGQEIQLQANLVNASSSTIIAGYIWNASGNINFNDCPDPDDCSDPTITPLQDDFIVVFAKEIIGNDTCLLSDTLRIDVSQDFKVFIPNAFSPNKDAQCINEHFEINILGAENLEVRIFNRWGEQVFYNPTQQNGPEDPNATNCDNPRGAWDGTFKGQPVPIGAYIYQLIVTYFDGTQETINGTVTVIR
jgi:gliding motility-associated-like protein